MIHSIILGTLTAANFYLFFEDGLYAASSSDGPSPDDADISESGPDSIPDDED